MANPKDRLRHHVTGAIERGEKQPVVAIDATKTIDITPNFSALVRRFTTSALGRYTSILGCEYAECDVPPREVHGILSELNCAVAALASTQDLEWFREQLSKAVAEVADKLAKEDY